MTHSPLPKTVAPVPDELLSGWLIRLATINYCEVDELLAHIGIAVRHPATFDFEVDRLILEKIAIAARLDPKTVGSLVFPPMSQAEALLTAQFPFQSCPECSRQGLALRHWRRAWAFDCQICGTRLLSVFAIQHGELASEKLLRRARRGAGHLELAIASNSAAQLRRAMRAVTFAMALKTVRGDKAFALQHPRPGVRIFCLAAIAAAQAHPLTKAALFSRSIDGFARAALLRTYGKEPRLLTAVDQIARRNQGKAPPLEEESRI